ncbi:hypothetical protein FACS189459_4290 [Bacilli bacterium]|nr:hypothetical protein FACS189459_4290 [Bacilli bacterium]
MRKGNAIKREVLADPVYNSKIVAKLISLIMYDGKKSLAQSTLYTAMKNAEEKVKAPAIDVLNKALDNIGPAVELKVRRVAGSNYQVPTEVNPERKITLALR